MTLVLLSALGLLLTLALLTLLGLLLPPFTLLTSRCLLVILSGLGTVLTLLPLLRRPAGLPGPLRIIRWLTGSLGDLAVDLVCQVFHLVLCQAQRGDLVAQNALGGTFHPLTELLDSLAGKAGCPRRLVGEAGVGQLPGLVNGLGNPLLIGLADGIKQILGQQGFGFLGLAHGVPHVLDEPVQLLALLFQRLLDLLAVGGVAEARAGVILPGVELLGQAVLALIELPGLVAHRGQVIGELVRRPLAQVVPDLVELLAGPGPLGQRLRHAALLERIGGLANPVARVLNLLAGVGHAVAVLFVLHSLLQLVGVAEDLLLLFTEALELSLDFLPGRLVLRGLERRLQLLQALVQVGLALGQFLEAAENLPGLALLLLLR